MKTVGKYINKFEKTKKTMEKYSETFYSTCKKDVKLDGPTGLELKKGQVYACCYIKTGNSKPFIINIQAYTEFDGPYNQWIKTIVFESIFYTKSEMRKLKLKKIQNENR